MAQILSYHSSHLSFLGLRIGPPLIVPSEPPTSVPRAALWPTLVSGGHTLVAVRLALDDPGLQVQAAALAALAWLIGPRRGEEDLSQAGLGPCPSSPFLGAAALGYYSRSHPLDVWSDRCGAEYEKSLGRGKAVTVKGRRLVSEGGGPGDEEEEELSDIELMGE